MPVSYLFEFNQFLIVFKNIYSFGVKNTDSDFWHGKPFGLFCTGFSKEKKKGSLNPFFTVAAYDSFKTDIEFPLPDGAGDCRRQ